MNFSSFIEWAFFGIVSGGVFILWQMKESVNSLNSKLEVYIVKQNHTDTKVEDHEVRIRDLETNRK